LYFKKQHSSLPVLFTDRKVLSLHVQKSCLYLNYWPCTTF